MDHINYQTIETFYRFIVVKYLTRYVSIIKRKEEKLQLCKRKIAVFRTDQ